MMFYALNIYPQINREISAQINAIRQDYDPTAAFAKPHITVMFPISEIVGEDCLIGHIQNVLNGFRPFEISLNGFHRSHDHWLFLIPGDGLEPLRKLYRAIYSGMLEKYRKQGIEFIPHLGLGLFIKEGRSYDWDNVREADFDGQRYEQAMRRAQALPLPITVWVEKLYLTKIPDEILEWATGKRAMLPEDARIVQVWEFYL